MLNIFLLVSDTLLQANLRNNRISVLLLRWLCLCQVVRLKLVGRSYAAFPLHFVDRFLAAQDPAWHAWDWSGRFCLVSRLWSPLVSLLEHGQTDGFAAFAPLVVHPGGPQWKADCRGSGYEVSKSLNPRREWSLTQFYSVDFSQSTIGVKNTFSIRAIEVCFSCF